MPEQQSKLGKQILVVILCAFAEGLVAWGIDEARRHFKPKKKKGKKKPAEEESEG